MAVGDVHIQVCGDLSVRVDGTVVTDALPGRQGRLLVAYLALHRGQSVSREQLLTAIWGDEASAERAQALNVVLSKAGRALGAAETLAATGAGGLQLAPEVVVDIETVGRGFELAAAAAERGA